MEYTKKILFVCVCFISTSALSIEQRKCENSSPCEFKTNEELQYPTQLVSKNHNLEVNLKVQMSRITLGGWLNLWRRTYNGQIGGPTWRVKAGDTVTVNLINKLGKNAPENSNKLLKFANSTNIFLHGLHVSPEDNDAMIRVNPGQIKSYKFKIGCKHPAGTFWYHPNVHGSTMFQTLSGMSGMIVVEDPVTTNPISSYSCPNNCDHEIQLLFQPTMLYKTADDGFSFVRIQKRIRDAGKFRNLEELRGGETLENWLTKKDNHVQFFTTNGQLQPRIRIESGKTMRFRMANAGGIHVLEISLPRTETGVPCVVHEIARDGIYLEHPRELQHGQTVIAQGGTADWLIRCDVPGNYKIESNPLSMHNSALTGHIRFRGLLANLEVIRSSKSNYRKSMFVGATLEENTPIVLPTRSRKMTDLRNVMETSIVGKFVVEAASNNLLNREKFISISKRAIGHKIPLDGVQEWTLLNSDSSSAHTLSIQGNPFQIISYNEYRGPISILTVGGGHRMVDQKGSFCRNLRPFAPRASLPKVFAMKKVGVRRRKYMPYNGKGFALVGDWRNTIILPPLSNVTIRFIPRDFIGKVLITSHNLLRQDLGMKMLIEIAKKGESMAVRSFGVKGGRPGTCRPKDFYPTVTAPSVKIGTKTLKNFFSWLYKTKPSYRKTYGDQRYLSRLYGGFLAQSQTHFTTGNHLKDFFQWAYEKFPSYKQHYGDQGYLVELYDYYISRKVIPKASSKNKKNTA
ncbi:uncharacterized protein LOC120344568 [Styela clava]